MIRWWDLLFILNTLFCPHEDSRNTETILDYLQYLLRKFVLSFRISLWYLSSAGGMVMWSMWKITQNRYKAGWSFTGIAPNITLLLGLCSLVMSSNLYIWFMNQWFILTFLSCSCGQLKKTAKITCTALVKVSDEIASIVLSFHRFLHE